MAILPRKIFSHMWFGFKPEINYYKSFIFLLFFLIFWLLNYENQIFESGDFFRLWFYFILKFKWAFPPPFTCGDWNPSKITFFIIIFLVSFFGEISAVGKKCCAYISEGRGRNERASVFIFIFRNFCFATKVAI